MLESCCAENYCTGELLRRKFAEPESYCAGELLRQRVAAQRISALEGQSVRELLHREALHHKINAP